METLILHKYLDTRKGPVVLVFEQFSKFNQEPGVTFKHKKDPGMNLAISGNIIECLKEEFIGVDIHPAWVSLLRSKLINQPGHYFIPTSADNDHIGIYCQVATIKGVLSIIKSGTELDINQDQSINWSMLTIVSDKDLTNGLRFKKPLNSKVYQSQYINELETMVSEEPLLFETNESDDSSIDDLDDTELDLSKVDLASLNQEIEKDLEDYSFNEVDIETVKPAPTLPVKATYERSNATKKPSTTKSKINSKKVRKQISKQNKLIIALTVFCTLLFTQKEAISENIRLDIDSIIKFFDRSKVENVTDKEYERILRQYNYAKSRYTTHWPDDSFALLEMLRIIEAGNNPTTYGQYTDWVGKVDFAIELEGEEANTIREIRSGINGDHIVSVRTNSEAKNEDI